MTPRLFQWGLNMTRQEAYSRLAWLIKRSARLPASYTTSVWLSNHIKAMEAAHYIPRKHKSFWKAA